MTDLKYKHRINIQGVNGQTITFDPINTPTILTKDAQINIKSDRYKVESVTEILKVNMDNQAQPIVHEVFYNVQLLT